MSISFATEYKNPGEFISKSGSGKIPVFKMELDKNGKSKVVKSLVPDKDNPKELVEQVDDVYSKIQANADSVDINLILKKYLATGDESILKQNPGLFVDLTEIPDNPVSMMNMIYNAKSSFAKLPANIKEKFDNDYKVFYAKSQSPEFLDLLGISNSGKPVDKPVDNVETPVEKPVEKEGE